jgi:hypothetical protein
MFCQCLKKIRIKIKNPIENDRIILLRPVSASTGQYVLERVNSLTICFCSSTYIGNNVWTWDSKTLGGFKIKTFGPTFIPTSSPTLPQLDES